MALAGFSPSVRLFEAAACGSPIISDQWTGIETLFAPAEKKILLAQSPDDLQALLGMSEPNRCALGKAGADRGCFGRMGQTEGQPNSRHTCWMRSPSAGPRQSAA